MMCKRRTWLGLVALLGVWLPSSAAASQTVKLITSFTPDRFGASATMNIGFRIQAAGTQAPTPLVAVDIRLPAGVSLTTSELGLATCDPAVLEAQGLDGCSPNSYMGLGNATVAVPDGAEVLHEPVQITVLMGPPKDRHTSMLFYANGTSPVIAQLLFPSVLLGESGPFGASLNTTVAVIPGLPGEPDSAITSLNTSIGPTGLTYYKHLHGTTKAYSPQGVRIPESCPRGGFPFAASFTFEDGTTASTSSTAPCPRGRAHHRGTR